MQDQPESLHLLQRAFGRTLQSQWISSHLLAPDEDLATPWPEFERFFIAREDLEGAFGEQDFYQPLEEAPFQLVDFARDVVITYPRKPLCTRWALKLIGEDQGTPWKQDEANHIIEGYLYFNVFWCVDGHHSTTVGILKQEGQMPVTQAYDLTFLFQQVVVSPDGQHYLKRDSGDQISPVPSQEFAALFRLAQARLQCGRTGY